MLGIGGLGGFDSGLVHIILKTSRRARAGACVCECVMQCAPEAERSALLSMHSTVPGLL